MEAEIAFGPSKSLRTLRVVSTVWKPPIAMRTWYTPDNAAVMQSPNTSQQLELIKSEPQADIPLWHHSKKNGQDLLRKPNMASFELASTGTPFKHPILCLPKGKNYTFKESALLPGTGESLAYLSKNQWELYWDIHSYNQIRKRFIQYISRNVCFTFMQKKRWKYYCSFINNPTHVRKTSAVKQRHLKEKLIKILLI